MVALVGLVVALVGLVVALDGRVVALDGRVVALFVARTRSACGLAARLAVLAELYVAAGYGVVFA